LIAALYGAGVTDDQLWTLTIGRAGQLLKAKYKQHEQAAFMIAAAVWGKLKPLDNKSCRDNMTAEEMREERDQIAKRMGLKK